MTELIDRNRNKVYCTYRHNSEVKDNGDRMFKHIYGNYNNVWFSFADKLNKFYRTGARF